MTDRRYPSPSHNFVPEYQQSGIPHVETKTGAAKMTFTFDTVTRWIVIDSNVACELYFSDTAAGDGNDDHYFLLPASSLVRLELKCKELYVVPTANATVSVIAGLTSINSKDFPDQTYANGFTGIENEPQQ